MKQLFEEKIMPLINKFSQHHYVKTIQQGVMGLIGITIFAGIISILKTPPFPPTFSNAFADGWRNFAEANMGWLDVVYEMSIEMMAMLAIIGIVISLCKHYKLEPLNYIVMSIASFLILSVNLTMVNPEDVNAGFLMDYGFLGAQGLFTAMVVGIFVVEFLRFMQAKNIKIKMPDGVPPMVSQPFESLIASGAVLGTVVIIRVILDSFGIIFPEIILLIIEPVIAGTSNIWVVILLFGFSRVLWFFGIHGTSILFAVLMPIMVVNGVENLNAYNAGQVPPNILTNSFIIFQLGMLPACIAMLIVCKSARLKTIAKLGVVPASFMISEPILFGTPFIFNPILFIPHILSFMLSIGISYFAMDIGLVGRPIFGIPATSPGPIAAFATTLDWRAVVLWFVVTALCVLLYAPFIKKYDRQILQEEEEEARAAEESNEEVTSEPETV